MTLLTDPFCERSMVRATCHGQWERDQEPKVSLKLQLNLQKGIMNSIPDLLFLLFIYLVQDWSILR